MTTRHDPQITRRHFAFYTAGLALAGSRTPALAGGVALSGKATPAPDAADSEIAQLGVRFREDQPELAAQLEKAARLALNLPQQQTLHWAEVHRAFPLLTAEPRVAAELRDEKIVFVDGWLLTHSEATIALLFAAADTAAASAPASR